jgi:carboxyl-terminal processing protease
MNRTHLKRLAAVVGLAALVALPLQAQEGSPSEQVDDLVNRMNQTQGEAVWNLALEAEALGGAAAHDLGRAVEQARGATRVALAKALLVMEGADAQHGQAIQALRDVIRGENDRQLRVRAAQLLGKHGRRSDVRPLERHLDGITDPIVKVHTLKVLRLRGRSRKAEGALKEFLESDDFGVRGEAALALAEIGNVEVARDVLTKLKDEPTERGQRAAAILEIEDLLAQVERYGALEDSDEILQQRNETIKSLQAEVEKLKEVARSGVGGEGASVEGGELFQELFDLIRSGYVDEDKTDMKDLVDDAASGIADSLDPFSSYMNKETLERFDQDLQQRYGGIGAVVQIDRKTGYLTITRPIYGNPADKAGLRTLDKIIEVEGQPTKGKTVSDLVKVLKGKPGTPVNMKVIPFLGPQEEKPVQVVRQQIMLRSVRYDMLPGDMGYIQLAQFGAFATQEVEMALAALEQRGMRGLIFDLRGNPGGLLSAAVEIADKFLDDDQLVVYSMGRGPRYGVRQEDGGPAVQHRRKLQEKHPDYPVVILIDENAASASEIVSGALQAHGRAELVGIQTFGKGSVQNIFKLDSMEGKAALRMTIAYYYLPDGRCIHRPRDVESWRFGQQMRMEIERWRRDGQLNDQQADELLEQYKPAPGGVQPDYKVEQPDIPMEKQRAFGQIYDQQLLEQYVQRLWLANTDAFHKLSLSDGFDPSAYPEFDALWAQVQEGLTQESRAQIDKNDVRMLLRNTVRRFTQDDLERELTSDYQEDRQLQAAIMIMAERTEQKLADVPELSFIPERFPEGLTRAERDAPQQPEEEGTQRDFKK